MADSGSNTPGQKQHVKQVLFYSSGLPGLNKRRPGFLNGKKGGQKLLEYHKLLNSPLDQPRLHHDHVYLIVNTLSRIFGICAVTVYKV